MHAGDTTVPSISVPTNSNTTPEDDRQFTVTLQTPVDIPDDASSDPSTAAIGTAPGTGTIIDDDWQIGAISTTPAGAERPRERRRDDRLHGVAERRLRAPTTHAITVDYAIADGSAQNGRDYTVTQPAGRTPPGR